jgi:hypothetical protein
MFKGPDIQKTPGLGAKSPSEDNVAGIVFGGVVPDTGTYTTLSTSVELLQAKDADALGLTTAYDAAKKVLVRYHIDEYFRLNPNGKLWIMVVAQATTLTQMCTLANAFVKKLIDDSNNAVRDIGVVRNPATGYVATLTNGLDGDVITSVSAAQLLVDDYLTRNIYIDGIWIEGREVNGTISAIKDLRTLSSANVRVVIAQDSEVAALDALFAKTAAVGSALGMNGIRRVEEDLGSINVIDNPDKSVENYPLNNGVVWEKPSISSGTLVKNLSAAEVQVLQDKGYIFADSWPSYPGVYFNKGNACTEADNDFAFISRMRTWNYFARIALRKFIPRYNKTVATVGGKMTTIEIASWQEDINNPRNGLGRGVVENHAVSASVFLNPDMVIDANDGEVIVEMEIGVFNYVRKITGKLKMTV